MRYTVTLRVVLDSTSPEPEDAEALSNLFGLNYPAPDLTVAAVEVQQVTPWERREHLRSDAEGVCVECFGDLERPNLPGAVDCHAGFVTFTESELANVRS